MIKVIFLDTSVLGVVTHPRAGAEAKECIAWLLNLLRAGARVCVPEICDYELRREYRLHNSVTALQHLDRLNTEVNYVPLNTPMMLKAADLWAEVRRRGQPTADAKELDGDVILAAQATLFAESDDDLVIATTNVGHLSRFVKAAAWQDITPN